jgi:WD40 repeat protein
MRHWGEVQAVAYSPDGKHVASGGADKKVRVWDATTGDEVFTLLGHTSTVVTVAYSADGKYLASAGWDTTIRLWDAKAGKEIRTLTGHDGQVYKVAFSPDSDRLVSGAAPNVNQVQVWDVATGQKIRSLVGHQGMVYGVAYSPDGRRIATCSLDQTVRVWDAQTGQELRTLKEFARVDRQGNNWVLSVAFSPDSKHVAAGSRDGIVRIWDADSGQQLQSLNIPAQHNNSGRIWTVAYHPDGHHLACTSDSEQFGKHEVIILDTKTWRIVDTIQTGRGGRFAYSSDGKRWVLACLQNRIRICDAETGKEVLPLTEYSTIKAIAFSGDGYRLAVAGQFLDREVHHAVKVRDLRTNQEIMTLKTSEDPLSTVFSPGALRLASRLVNLGFWDVGSGRQLSTAKGLAVRMGQPMPLAFTPDGGRVAAGVSDGKVVIFEVAKGTLQREFQAHGAQVTAVLYSPDGQWLVTGGQDRLLKLWAAGSAQAKGDLFGHAGVIQTLAFSADGQFLASAGSAAVEDKEPWAEIILWRFPEQKEQLKFRTDSQRVFSLSFSSDGALLASAGDDGRVSLWQTSSGKRRQTWQFPGHVQQVLFAPDGRHLLTLNANGTVYILRLPDPAVLPK